MITILSGKPGTGKTAYAVAMLLDDKEIADRPIYTNITDLKLPHFTIDADWLRNWHTNAPPGAFILFDECQDVFEPRHTSKPPPEFVNELTKHRKDYSVDFFLITQKPGFIDFMVRGLCQRHIHIRETGLTRMIHEASEVVDFEQKQVREIYSSKPYSLPKRVFDLYTSAQVHTKKQKRSIPTAVYMFAVAGAMAFGLGYYIYTEKLSPHLAQLDGKQEQAAAGLPAAPVMIAHNGLNEPQRVPVSMLEATTPTDDHNPLSAPLYAAVAPPPVAPEVQGCIASIKRCTCYSQQQTPIWLPEEQCRQRAAGLYYDPYRQPMPPQREETRQQTTVAATATAKEARSQPVEQNPSPML